MLDTILWPLKIAVAWIMVQFHNVLVWLGLESSSGASWALSVVGLVIVMRIVLIPLFVKQIKASRNMQLLAPEMQKIQKKYKNKKDPASREAMSRETMELYRRHGTNPFASCLPILAQSPVFFALFRVLYSLPALARGEYRNGEVDSIGPLTQELAREMSEATIFGAPISSWFLQPGASAAVKVVTVVLILAMSATTFLTQRQLTRKNMPAAALEGPMAQQQKMLLYVLPVIFAVTGVNFPIGVLIYWTTTNLWSMAQQFYVIRRMPTPGSQAEQALKERRARRAARKGLPVEEEKPAIEEKPRGQRQQPKRKDRQRPGSGPGAARPAAQSGAGSGTAAQSADGSANGEQPAENADAAGVKGSGGNPGGQSSGGKGGGGKKSAQQRAAERAAARKAQAQKAAPSADGKPSTPSSNGTQKPRSASTPSKRNQGQRRSGGKKPGRSS